MVAPIGARAGGLFERQIFTSALVVERAHRRLAIRPVEQDAASNPHARTQRDRIGRKPLRGIHGAEQVLLRTDRADIDRISGNIGAGTRDHGQSSKALLMFVMPPRQRDEKIGQETVQHAADDQYKKQELGVPGGRPEALQTIRRQCDEPLRLLQQWNQSVSSKSRGRFCVRTREKSET